MKRTATLIITALFATAPLYAQAPQDNKREPLSQEQYNRELEQFIVKEAMLSPQEAANFFPVFEEMRQKQRIIYDAIKRKERQLPVGDEQCLAAIRERDQQEIELKQIQQTYHNKFLSILPASKVMKIIAAEDHFHHSLLRDGGKKQPGNGPEKK